MAIGLSRVTIPQEFYDRTSSQLLIQPDPQYIHAKLMLDALGASLDVPDMVGLPGREIGGQGADYQTFEQGQLMLEPNPLTTDLIQVAHDFKGETGSAVMFNRPKFTDWAVAESDRRVIPGQTISTTSVSVGSEQAVLNLGRYAGPYSSTTSGSGNIAPLAIEKFDAERGVHNLVKVQGLHLKRDFHRFMNYQGIQIFNDAATTIRPVGMTNDNTATTKGQFPLDYETVTRTARTMDDANIPTLGDGRRVLIVTPTGLGQLRRDRNFVLAAKEESSKNPLMYRYSALRAVLPEWYVFVSNQLTTADNTSSISIHSAQAIAPGCMGVGMGSNPRIAPHTSDNYGESVPVIWIAYLAFTNLDNRFCYLVNYTEDAT